MKAVQAIASQVTLTSGGKVLEVMVSADGYRDICIGMIALLHDVIPQLEITATAAGRVAIGKKKQRQSNYQASLMVAENGKHRVEISQEAMETLVSFYIRGAVNGATDVDHIDLECGSDGYVIFKSEAFSPPLSPGAVRQALWPTSKKTK